MTANRFAVKLHLVVVWFPLTLDNMQTASSQPRVLGNLFVYTNYQLMLVRRCCVETRR